MKLLAFGALSLATSAALAQTETIGPVERDTAAVEPFGEAEQRNCDDRITQVRSAIGQPTLDKRPASPDEAYFSAAVDQSIDGCAVMVMRQDTTDVRPLPKFKDDVKLRKLN